MLGSEDLVKLIIFTTFYKDNYVFIFGCAVITVRRLSQVVANTGYSAVWVHKFHTVAAFLVAEREL